MRRNFHGKRAIGVGVRSRAAGKKGFFKVMHNGLAHIPPLEGWYSRDSLCYGVGARMMYIMQKFKENGIELM
jgi:hypothetical protein